MGSAGPAQGKTVQEISVIGEEKWEAKGGRWSKARMFLTEGSVHSDKPGEAHEAAGIRRPRHLTFRLAGTKWR